MLGKVCVGGLGHVMPHFTESNWLIVYSVRFAWLPRYSGMHIYCVILIKICGETKRFTMVVHDFRCQCLRFILSSHPIF